MITIEYCTYLLFLEAITTDANEFTCWYSLYLLDKRWQPEKSEEKRDSNLILHTYLLF